MPKSAPNSTPNPTDSSEHKQPQVEVDHSPKPAHATTGSSTTPKSRLNKTPKMVANGSRAFIWYLLSLVVIIIDQWTKWLAETKLNFLEPVPVIEPFLNWTLAYNYGAAFSFLADAGGWQKWFFSGISVVAVLVIVYLLKKYHQQKLFSLGLALVLGGAIGNLYDRLTLGYVVDFLHFHYQAHAWPAFNVADSAICVGVALLLIDSFTKPKTVQ